VAFTLGHYSLFFGQCSIALVSQKNDSCFENKNGSATVVASSGASPYNYVWLGGGGTRVGATANDLGAGTYTVTMTDNNGCKAVTTVTITAPNPLTAGASSSPATTGKQNGTATADPLGGTPLYTYLWTPGGATGITDTGLSGNATYTVLVTDSKGCTASTTVIVGLSTGINEINMPANFSLYPNPAKNKINIDLINNYNNPLVLSLYDMLGNTLAKTIVTEGHTELNISTFPSGIYLIELKAQTNGIASRKKILIE